MIRKHLSYANVMSSLAVFLLLGGGGAIAAQQKVKRIGANQIKAQAITTAKLKNGAVTAPKLAPGAVEGSRLADGAVSTAKLAPQAVGAAQLQNDSVSGEKVIESSLSEVPAANSANPYAFARVNANGTVDGARSKGLTSVNVAKAATGVYCLSPQGFAARGGQLTPERSAGNPVTATLTISGAPTCGAQIQVETFVGGALADAGFYVSLHR